MTHTHYTRLTALCPGLPRWAGTRKVKPVWILLKQETVSGSGISWAIWKSAPRSRQITMPVPHHSVFTGRMPFLPPNQQRQSTEGTMTHTQCTSYPCADFSIHWRVACPTDDVSPLLLEKWPDRQKDGWTPDQWFMQPALLNLLLDCRFTHKMMLLACCSCTCVWNCASLSTCHWVHLSRCELPPALHQLTTFPSLGPAVCHGLSAALTPPLDTPTASTNTKPQSAVYITCQQIGKST